MKLSKAEFRAMQSLPRKLGQRFFDATFRWGHPDTDFGFKALETHLTSRGLVIQSKQWTPLLTMDHAAKTRGS